MGDRLADSIGDFFSSVALFVPKALGFLVILLIGFIIAKVLESITDRSLNAVNFNGFVSRVGGSLFSRPDFDASALAAKVVYFIVALFTLQLGFGLWGDNPISDLLHSIIAFIPKFVVAVIIVLLAAAIARAAKNFVMGALSGLGYSNILANTAYVFILGLGVITALSQVGIAVAVTLPILYALLLTVSGILIVGVGGGLITPMRARWEGWLTAAREEMSNVQEVAESNDVVEPE